MVSTTDHVAHFHIPVVDHHSEVVGRNAVTHDDQVIEFAVADCDRAIDSIIPGDSAFVRVTETNHRLDAFRDGLTDTVFRTPTTVVTGFETLGLLFFTHGVKFFGRSVAVVSATVGQHLVNDFTIALKTIHLINGTFVIVEVKPLHAVKNDLNSFLRGTNLVGIFDAKQELAAEMASNSPAINGRTGRAKVHHARGARCNTRANRLHW